MYIDGDKHLRAMQKLHFLTAQFANAGRFELSQNESNGVFWILSDIIDELSVDDDSDIKVKK